MEIFQTIWTSLTSENEVLISILKIIFTFIESTITLLLFKTILGITSSKKQSFTFICLLSLLAIITNNFIITPFNTFINIILLPFFTFIIFKTTLLKSILSEIIPYILFLILGCITQLIFVKLLNIPAHNINIIPIYKFFHSSLLYLFSFLFFCLCYKFKIQISLPNTTNNRENSIILFNFIIGTLAIATQSYLIHFYIDILPYKTILTNVITIVLYFLISIFSLYRTKKLEITNQDLEEAKLYNKTLSILHDNIRGFKHDFNNIVQAIGGYVATEDIEGLKKYYSDLLADCQKTTNLSTLNPQVINSPPIFSILTDKYHKADEKGIKINLEIFLDLNTINMKMYEFTRILGILLDNAIEAANECDEKIINIQMRKDSKVNRQLVIIENTYYQKDINIDKIFEKSYSTKPNNTGLGLWEVRQILKKHNNLNLFTTKDNKFFKQQLEIYTK